MIHLGSDQTRIGAVVFSNNADLEWQMDKYSTANELAAAAQRIRFRGGTTNTYSGLTFARERCFNSNYGARDSVTNLAIIITDGVPTVPDANGQDPVALAKQAAIALKSDPVKAKVFVLGVTDAVDKDTLEYLSSGTGYYFATPDFSQLSGVLNTLLQGACEVSTLAPPPSVGKINTFLPPCSSYTTNTALYCLCTHNE